MFDSFNEGHNSRVFNGMHHEYVAARDAVIIAFPCVNPHALRVPQKDSVSLRGTQVLQTQKAQIQMWESLNRAASYVGNIVVPIEDENDEPQPEEAEEEEGGRSEKDEEVRTQRF